MSDLEIGFNIPACKGMSIKEIQTPCLIVNFDTFSENIAKMKSFVNKNNVLLRPHAKMHKSIDVANYQFKNGGAHGICCQKVSEAEVFVKLGVKDILITNQICDHLKIDRLTKLPKFGSTIGCCVDSAQNIIDIQKFAFKNKTILNIYIEINCGANRCGVNTHEEINNLMNLIKKSSNLNFSGLQAYNGSNQHIKDRKKRKNSVLKTINIIRNMIDKINVSDVFITGGGTGCFEDEVDYKIYNEIQTGSYPFMDAHYSSIIKDLESQIIFKNSLFVLTTVMSKNNKNISIVDAGLKSLSLDSGLPKIFNNPHKRYIKCSDEHGVIEEKYDELKINDKIFLVPGHCDPTCNLHDWYVVVKDDYVIDLWPISARGYSF